MKQYCVIGASAAGISACTKLLTLEPQAKIICITKESLIPYNKCLLADYIAEKKSYHELSIIKNLLQSNIQFKYNETVHLINSKQSFISTNSNTTYHYDALIIAIGLQPITLPRNIITCNHICNGIFSFYTMQDAENINNYIKTSPTKTALIIGGGLSGLEIADSLNQRGIITTIIEKQSHIFETIISNEGSLLIQQYAHQANTSLYCSTTVINITCNINNQKHITLSNKKTITADIIINACGAKLDLDFINSAGIEITSHGIITNEHLNTNINNIYAAGDCALVKHMITNQTIRSNTWPDAIMQGSYAAHAITGNHKKYQGAIPTISSSFFGCKIYICPLSNKTTQATILTKKTKESLINVYLNANNQVLGFALIGNTHNAAYLKRILITQETINLISVGF